MKEAAGEANMTVITIVLIGLVAAAGAIIIPRIIKGMDAKSCCQENGGTYYSGKCYKTDSCAYSNGKVDCSVNGAKTFDPSCN